MISSTIKKAIVIYRLISSALFLFLSFQSFAQEDLASFCFERNVKLEEARDSLSFLLLPKEQVFLRSKDHCIDISTSTNRVNLLEKFLRKRYTLLKDYKETEPKIEEHCQIELISKKKKNTDAKNVRLGTQNSIGVGSTSVEEVSNSKILLGIGKPGTLEMEGRALYVECRPGQSGYYNLTFSYSEMYRTKVSTEVNLKAGEPLAIAQVTNDLGQKSKTLGLPETLYKDIQGKENITYELIVR